MIIGNLMFLLKFLVDAAGAREHSGGSQGNGETAMEVDLARVVYGGSHGSSLPHTASVAGAAESARAPTRDACTVPAGGRKGILPGAHAEGASWIGAQREAGLPPPEVPSRPAASPSTHSHAGLFPCLDALIL